MLDSVSCELVWRYYGGGGGGRALLADAEEVLERWQTLGHIEQGCCKDVAAAIPVVILNPVKDLGSAEGQFLHALAAVENDATSDFRACHIE